MRIAHFRVEKYRSITRSESIDLTTMSVLVGPNNEGKSNILRSLVVGLQALQEATATPRPRTRNVRGGVLRHYSDSFEQYYWERDFPLQLQAQTPGASSVFEFQFSFTDDEVVAFRKEVGHALNGELKLRVLIGNGGKFQVKAIKRGRGSAGLNDKIAKVASFASQRIRVQYIPVSRTSEESRQIVRSEVSAILRRLTEDDDYRRAMETIERLSCEALQPLEEGLLEAAREFLPDVASVHIKRFREPMSLLSRELDIELDDGQATSLSAKGDGIQSLIAISLIKRLARQSPLVSYILAVEEPEAHLHPGAVHKLKQVLLEVAERDQVILTTHSPILVSRDDCGANILVTNNTAVPARSLEQVRQSLGIQLPDNMISSEVVLIVEGRHDKETVTHLLGQRSPELGRALREGRLSIIGCGGAAAMPYQYRLFRDSVCKTHVLLDDDKEGRAARRKLDEDECLRPGDATMISAMGMTESELEDLFPERLFSDYLLSEYNVLVDSSDTVPVKRFSLRMKEYFSNSGQAWNSSVESNLKKGLSSIICNTPTVPLRGEFEGVVKALARALESKLLGADPEW